MRRARSVHARRARAIIALLVAVVVVGSRVVLRSRRSAAPVPNVSVTTAPRSDLAVSAATLFADYAAGELGANHTYRGKMPSGAPVWSPICRISMRMPRWRSARPTVPRTSRSTSRRPLLIVPVGSASAIRWPSNASGTGSGMGVPRFGTVSSDSPAVRG